eukprot:9110637-Pyramimonas_sp.AAC.1
MTNFGSDGFKKACSSSSSRCRDPADTSCGEPAHDVGMRIKCDSISYQLQFECRLHEMFVYACIITLSIICLP